MKTTFFLLILATLISYSCEKTCYICTTVVTQTVSPPVYPKPKPTSTVVELCENVRQINKYIDEHTFTTKETVNGFYVVTKSTCMCE